MSRSLTRDASSVLGMRMAAIVCSSVTALVIAASLDQQQYGAYAIVVGINVVLIMALDLGLTASLARFVGQGRAGMRLVGVVGAVRLACIGAAALLILVAWRAGGLGSASLAPLLPALALLIVGQSMVSFHFGLLPTLRRIRLLVALTLLQPVLELALVLGVRERGGGAQEMLLATACAALAAAVVGWVLLLARARQLQAPTQQDAPATLGMVVRYGRAIFLVTILIALLGQIDQFIIGFFHPLADVAPYALSMKFQALCMAAATAVAGIVAPVVATTALDDRVRALGAYRQWMRALAFGAAGLVAVLAVLAREAFGVISSQYEDDFLILAALAPFLVIAPLGALPSLTLNQLGSAGRRMRIALVTLVINGVLDLLLVPWLGAYGAAVGTTAAFAWYVRQHHVLVVEALGGAAGDERRWRLQLAGAALAVAAAAALGAAAVREVLGVLAPQLGDLGVLLAAGTPPALATLWLVRRGVRGAATR